MSIGSAPVSQDIVQLCDWETGRDMYPITKPECVTDENGISQADFNAIVSEMESRGYICMGAVKTKSPAIELPSVPAFWFAKEQGIYENYGTVNMEKPGLSMIMFNPAGVGDWSIEPLIVSYDDNGLVVRLNNLDKKTDATNREVNTLKQTTADTDKNLGETNKNLEAITKRVGGLDTKTDNTNTAVGNVEKRVGDLETKTGETDVTVAGLSRDKADQSVVDAEFKKTNAEVAKKANNVDMTKALSGKQDTLKSGVNIKTINGQSIIEGGNIDVLTAVDTELSDISGNPIKNSTVHAEFKKINDEIVKRAIKTEVNRDIKRIEEESNRRDNDIDVTREVTELRAEIESLKAIIDNSGHHKALDYDSESRYKTCGSFNELYGHGTPSVETIPDQKGIPAFIGQHYINLDAPSNGFYYAVGTTSVSDWKRNE